MASKRIAVALLGCGLVVGSCDGSTDVPLGNGGTPIPIEDMPQKIAAAICAAFEECLGDFHGLMMGDEDCQQLIENGFANGAYQTMLEAIDAGTASYHGDKAQACLDALAALGCDAMVSHSIPECDEVFVGTVAEGGDCTYGIECVGDLFCKIEAACPGTCSSRGGNGADCEDDDHCQDGMFCDEGTSTCASPVVQGASCGGSSGDECAPGLMCAGEDEDGGTPGTCSTPAEVFVGEVGDSCDLMEGLWCQLGAYCAIVDFVAPDTLVSECVAAADSGGSCHPAAPDMCPAGEYCDVPDQSLDGSCQPLPQAGEACGGSWSKQCELYHRCVNDLCYALEENGGSCTDDEICYSDSCNSGTCGPYDPC